MVYDRFVDRDMLMRYMGGGIGHRGPTAYPAGTTPSLERDVTSREDITTSLQEPDSPVLNSLTPSPPPHSFGLEHDDSDELEISEEEASDIGNNDDDDDDGFEDDNSIDEAEGYNSS